MTCTAVAYWSALVTLRHQVCGARPDNIHTYWTCPHASHSVIPLPGSSHPISHYPFSGTYLLYMLKLVLHNVKTNEKYAEAHAEFLFVFKDYM